MRDVENAVRDVKLKLYPAGTSPELQMGRENRKNVSGFASLWSQLNTWLN